MLSVVFGLSLIAQASGGVALDWPDTECPSAERVLLFLESIAPIDTSTTVSVRGELDGDAWTITVPRGAEDVVRRVPARGSCDQRAANIAAVIEQGLRQPETLPPPKPAKTATASKEVAVPAPAPTPPEPPRSLVRLSLLGVFGIGNRGGTVLSLEGQGAWWLGDLFAGLRLGWSIPKTEDVFTGSARRDALFAALAGGWAFAPSVAVQVTAGLEGVRAKSVGLAQTDSQIRANPWIGLGLEYADERDSLSPDLALRGLIFLRSQEFVVSDVVVFEEPLAMLQLAAGFGLGL